MSHVQTLTADSLFKDVCFTFVESPVGLPALTPTASPLPNATAAETVLPHGLLEPFLSGSQW